MESRFLLEKVLAVDDDLRRRRVDVLLQDPDPRGHQPLVRRRRHEGIVGGDEIGQGVGPHPKPHRPRLLHAPPEAGPAVREEVLQQVEMAPGPEGPAMVERREPQAPRVLQHRVDRSFAEGGDEIRPAGHAGGLDPLAVDHGVRQSLGHLDRPDGGQRRFGRRAEQGQGAAFQPESRQRLDRDVLVLGPDGHDPVPALVDAERLQARAELLRGGRRPAARGALLVDQLASAGLRVQGLEADGEFGVPHDPDDLADGLADRGVDRPPEHGVDLLRVDRLGQLEAEIAGLPGKTDPELDPPVEDRGQDVLLARDRQGRQLPAVARSDPDEAPGPRFGNIILPALQVQELDDLAAGTDLELEGRGLYRGLPARRRDQAEPEDQDGQSVQHRLHHGRASFQDPAGPGPGPAAPLVMLAPRPLF